jgi:hypothetical protein
MTEFKWIEQIRVRSSLAALRAAMPSLRRQVEEIEASVPEAEPFFLQHALYDGDLAVVVIWRGVIAPEKTREGLMIAEHLQALGSVDHAVWIPANE